MPELKLCKDCDWYTHADVPIWHGEYEHTCHAPIPVDALSEDVNLVTGTKGAFIANSCGEVRYGLLCGPEAKLFKPKVIKQVDTPGPYCRDCGNLLGISNKYYCDIKDCKHGEKHTKFPQKVLDKHET